MKSLLETRRSLNAVAGRLCWFPAVLTRLTLGVIFVGTGWGKLHNLEKVTNFFTQLHIPAPSFNAALVGATELVCGILLLLGLLTRLAAVPLIVTMCLAILTARSSDVEGVRDLFALQEFDYLVLLVWMAIAGGGVLSLDHPLVKALERREVNPQLAG